jgi:hypothetical protein
MFDVAANRVHRVPQGPKGTRIPQPARSDKESFTAPMGWALVAGLVAAWAATIIASETAPGDNLLNQESKPGLFYVLHGFAILIVMGVGVHCLLAGRLRRLRPGVQLSFAVLFCSAAAWSLTSYTWGEIFSPVIVGATGPFVWFSLLFLLAGTDPGVWKAIDLTIGLLTCCSTLLAWRALLTSAGFVYGIAYSKITMYVTVLAWLGGWTLLSATRKRGWPLFLRAIPFLTFVLLAVYSQARSWIILSLILSCFFLRLRYKEHGSIRTVLAVVAGGAIVAVVSAMCVYAIAPERIQNSLDGLRDRLYDDTRSSEYDEFAADVPLSDLLFGRGPKGTWYWSVAGDYQFFDNGYLWMLFIGGVPTLLSYCAIVVLPALRAVWWQPRGPDGAAVFLVLLWAIALTGLSTFTLPSLSFTNYLIALFAGRCHAFVANRNAAHAVSWRRPAMGLSLRQC